MDFNKTTISTTAPQTTAQAPQRKILLAIFMEVFLGFFAGIAISIWNFFKHYLLLVWFYILFLIKPNAENYDVHRKKAIDNSKSTFQLIMILTAILIFCIKQGWITGASEENTQAYGNDMMAWFMEFVIFIVYAACYFLVLLLLVLLGRLLRKIFSPIESSRVTDLVFIHLNNIFFITAAICSFIIRFDNVASDFLGEDKDYEMEHFQIVLFNTFGIPFAIITFLFFIRLTMINKLPALKSIFYVTLVPAIVFGFLLVCEIFISSFMAGL
ncbi:MAG: hypothetical protein V4722_07640 [Bacteroidota bacterium]